MANPQTDCRPSISDRTAPIGAEITSNVSTHVWLVSFFFCTVLTEHPDNDMRAMILPGPQSDHGPAHSQCDTSSTPFRPHYRFGFGEPRPGPSLSSRSTSSFLLPLRHRREAIPPCPSSPADSGDSAPCVAAGGGKQPPLPLFADQCFVISSYFAPICLCLGIRRRQFVALLPLRPNPGEPQPYMWCWCVRVSTSTSY